MKAGQGREIVIEYERVQRIKKRSSTHLLPCDGCGSISDFVSVSAASSLFDIEVERLNDFISANHCHVQINDLGRSFVCLASLLASMKIKAEVRRLEPFTENSTIIQR
jgi:hypothetical protein